MIRNSLKYVSHRDMKEFANDLKSLYRAATEESAMASLDELKSKWGGKHPLAINAWERNWDRICTMFRFTEEIRKLIYTTNPVESVHSQFRKVTSGKGHFPDDTSVLKVLYLAGQKMMKHLAGQKMMKRWTVRIPNWSRILAQLAIHFGDRVGKYL